jgi:propionyl-CoA carboxylase alpha chain
MIRRILVANRGEIARRVFRTCRARMIETVAIYSDPDAGEPHVLEADSAVHVAGSTPAETYLDIGSVLAAAIQSGADAIHPGYGFLAENPEFARQVMAKGLNWIGPSPEAIEVMGSKLASKDLMRARGVPVLDSQDLSGMSDEEAIQSAARIGYPVLVKASAGGGGKGMRIVTEPTALADAISGARREAASAFGDDTMFLEKYLEAPRHIEIQVLGDVHGTVISLFERECSIQRRHQKIIEEAPSPVVDEDLRRRMGGTAIRAAEAVGYVGAGTVEFLLQEDEFYFLEMNTRLQVEHPVTEMITGLDLVGLQIEVAEGTALELSPSIAGHAIEARLYAEDALHGFLPATGKLHRFDFVDGEGLRVDSGVETGSEVSMFYDPMLAKVIAHAPTRDQAVATLAAALRRARIHGPTTNRALLVRVLEHPEFLAGAVDTHFLDRHDIEVLARPLADRDDEQLAAIVAALSDQALERDRARVLDTIPSGWRNSPHRAQERSFRGDHGIHTIRYSATDGFLIDGAPDLDVVSCTSDLVELVVGGDARLFTVSRYGDIRHVDSESAPARLMAVPRFPLAEATETPGSLHAPMPGRVIRVDAVSGESVTSGQVLVVLEAMKMEHSLRAPHDGLVVEVDCSPGDQVPAGAVLVVIESQGQPPSTLD